MEEFETPVECSVCHEIFDSADETNRAPFKQYSGRKALKVFCPHCGEWYQAEEN